MKKLFRTGISDFREIHINKKIILSNTIAIIFGIAITVPFIFISWIALRPLTWMPVAATIIAWMVPLLNRFSLTTISRYTISLLPITLATFYHASLVSGHTDGLPSMFLIMMGFGTVPFLIFDFKEINHLITSSLIAIAYFLFFDFIAANYNISNVNPAVLESGWLAQMVIMLAVIIIFSGIFILSKLAHDSEKKTVQIMEELRKNNEEVEKSQNELKRNIELLTKAKEEENERNWATNGRNGLSEIIRESQHDDDVYDKMLSFIVKYMKINQGGIYLVIEDYEKNKFIEMVSCFAYDRRKHEEKRIELGQGLLGQCYYERSMIHIKEVPEDYITITSGLGEATPKALIIMPMIFNEEITGFIELASFQDFKEFEIEFIQAISIDLASFTFNFNVNKKTRYLLDEAKETEDQLRAVEEEMRQNMEELLSTEEEMSRKEKEYHAEIERLKEELAKLST